MDLEETIKRQLETESPQPRKQRKSKKESMPIPIAIRTIRNPGKRQYRSRAARGKINASELRIRQAIKVDQRAQRRLKSFEDRLKRQALKESKAASPRQSIKFRADSSTQSHFRRNHAPSKMQRGAGYVARFTPATSAVATGSMGALSNGLKPMGITALFNALLDTGKQKKSAVMQRLGASMRTLLPISRNGKAAQRTNKPAAKELALKRDFKHAEQPHHTAKVLLIERNLKIAEKSAHYCADSKLHTLIATRRRQRELDKQK